MVELVLETPMKDSRDTLHAALELTNNTEGQFYQSIIEHEILNSLTTVQRFELLSKLPNRILRSQIELEKLLSEEQLKLLPPITG